MLDYKIGKSVLFEVTKFVVIGYWNNWKVIPLSQVSSALQSLKWKNGIRLCAKHTDLIYKLLCWTKSKIHGAQKKSTEKYSRENESTAFA